MNKEDKKAGKNIVLKSLQDIRLMLLFYFQEGEEGKKTLLDVNVSYKRTLVIGTQM